MAERPPGQRSSKQGVTAKGGMPAGKGLSTRRSSTPAELRREAEAAAVGVWVRAGQGKGAPAANLCLGGRACPQ